MDFDPNSTAGEIAIAFIIVTFVLLVILITTCIVCWCWRYKLHKRKEEIKVKDYEIGYTTTQKKRSGCRCCGCWVYCCRCCRGCCEPAQKVKVLNPNDPAIITTTATAGKCGCNVGSSGNQGGWGKDVIVYNTGTPVTTSTHTCSQPVNFSNRWSSCNDGRLVLNAPGVASKFTPGIQTYGGIYPSVPSGISASDQFLLTTRKGGY